MAAATRSFAVHGCRKVSLAPIAAEVGITEQGAMHYFPTKEHLLLGVLDSAMSATANAGCGSPSSSRNSRSSSVSR